MVTYIYPDEKLYVVLINWLIVCLLLLILYVYMFDLKSWSDKLNITITNAEVFGKLIYDKLFPMKGRCIR